MQDLHGTAHHVNAGSRHRHIRWHHCSWLPLALIGLQSSAATPALPQRPFFEPNKGQFIQVDGTPAPNALLRAEGRGLAMYVTTTGLSYVFARTEDGSTEERTSKHDPRTDRYDLERDPVKLDMAWAHMRLEGASIREENIMMEEEGTARFDYYLKNAPEGISVHKYGRVTVREVYPGIDWVLYTNSDGLKYDFIVHPNGDAKVIGMIYHSDEPVRLEPTGELTIKTAMGSITEHAPVSYWKESGKPVASTFTQEVLDEHRVRVRFAMNATGADATGTLVIDPELTWATFTNSETSGIPLTIKTKSNGDVIMAGIGWGGFGFPAVFDTLTFSGAYTDATMGGLGLGHIHAFNSSGVLLWSTLYAEITDALQLNIDVNDRILLVGKALTGFPTFAGIGSFAGAYHQDTCSAGADVMIIGFSPSGERQWATFLGGMIAHGIATSPTGRIVIAAETDAGAHADVPGIGSFTGAYHQSPAPEQAYLLGFEPNGALSWATGFPLQPYMASSVAFRPTGEYILAGIAGPGCPVLANGAFSGATMEPIAGTADGYIAGFGANGAQLWGSYIQLGDENYEWASRIHGAAIGPDGRIVLQAEQIAPGFTQFATGIFSGAYQGLEQGDESNDICLFGYDGNGQLQWRTRLGGAYFQYSMLGEQQVAMDPCGNIATVFQTQNVYGESLSPLPVFGPCGSYLDGIMGDGAVEAAERMDMAIMRFTPEGQLTWSTLYGGAWLDLSTPVTFSAQGALYVAGASEGHGFTTVDPGNGAWYVTDSLVTSGGSGFILRFTPSDCDGPTCSTFHATATNDLVTCAGDCDGTVTATPMNGTAPYTFLWENGQTTATATGLCPGTHSCTMTDAAGLSYTVNTLVQEPPPIDVVFYTLPSDCSDPTGTLAINTVQGGFTGGLGYPAGFTFGWSHSTLDTNYFEGVGPGEYVLTITDAGGCAKVDTAYVPQFSQPALEVSTADSALEAGESTELIASGAIAYTWTPGTGLSCTACERPIASPSDTTTYCVVGYDMNGCSDTLCLTIFATPPCDGVYVPTAFSPDGSARNDLHCVYGECIRTMTMSIYDRWGKLVFESTGPGSCWDGTFKGEPLDAAVFVYSLAAILTTGKTIEQQGNITMFR